jgi:phage shock protein PspC (stress-responsive transcriptional regulator)
MKGAILGGVFSGYAGLFNVNPMLIRLVAGFFLVIFPYCLLWALYPKLIMLRICVTVGLLLIPYLIGWSAIGLKKEAVVQE